MASTVHILPLLRFCVLVPSSLSLIWAQWAVRWTRSFCLSRLAAYWSVVTPSPLLVTCVYECDLWSCALTTAVQLPAERDGHARTHTKRVPPGLQCIADHAKSFILQYKCKRTGRNKVGEKIKEGKGERRHLMWNSQLLIICCRREKARERRSQGEGNTQRGGSRRAEAIHSDTHTHRLSHMQAHTWTLIDTHMNKIDALPQNRGRERGIQKGRQRSSASWTRRKKRKNISLRSVFRRKSNLSVCTSVCFSGADCMLDPWKKIHNDWEKFGKLGD